MWSAERSLRCTRRYMEANEEALDLPASCRSLRLGLPMRLPLCKDELVELVSKIGESRSRRFVLRLSETAQEALCHGSRVIRSAWRVR